MANQIKWPTPGTYTTAIAGAGVAPTLKALASNGRKLGSAIDTASGGKRDQYADFDLQVRGASAFTAGALIELYLIPAVDGTNYTDGDDSTDPPATTFVGAFPVRAVTTQQRIALTRVPLPNTPFKPLIYNKAGQAFTNTDNENVLSYRTYNDEIQ